MYTLTMGSDVGLKDLFTQDLVRLGEISGRALQESLLGYLLTPLIIYEKAANFAGLLPAKSQNKEKGSVGIRRAHMRPVPQMCLAILSVSYGSLMKPMNNNVSQHSLQIGKRFLKFFEFILLGLKNSSKELILTL